MEIHFRGKTVVITGAAGGLGSAMAEHFAMQGANVALCDYSERVTEEAEALQKQELSAVGMAFDVTDLEAVRTAMQKITEQFGVIDVLVNNAGINVGPEQRRTVENFSDEWWDKIQAVDLKGVYHCSKAAIPLMNPDGASIVNISSIVGIVPLRNQCSFAAAKAGVIQLSKAMALELAEKKIRVNVVAPGTVGIAITNRLWAEDSAMQRLLAHIPMNRQAVPEEIADAVSFLASDAASYITGVVLPVDGGWTAGGFARDF